MIDIAYLAGIIDARAHVEPERTRLTVTTKRLNILEHLGKCTGVQPIIISREYNKRGCSEHCEERHQHVQQSSPYWSVRGLRAFIIADNVYPYLVESQILMAQLIRHANLPLDPTRNEIGAYMKRMGWRVDGDIRGAQGEGTTTDS